MSTHLGNSVGLWNANINEEQFQNVSGKPFYMKGTTAKGYVYRQLGITAKEYFKRRDIYNDLSKNVGLSDFQINEYWNEYQSRGNTSSDGFKNFVLDQLLLKEAEIREEQEKIDLLKDDLVISDDAIKNIQSPVVNNKSNQQPVSTEKSRNPNLIIYSVIGLVVVTGIVILIAKRK
tara:strand:- start:4740 stop:5267 length:528 start_codon:yes stop_codon:yes gene_type:complete